MLKLSTTQIFMVENFYFEFLLFYQQFNTILKFDATKDD